MIVIPLGETLAPGRVNDIRACLLDDGVIAYPTDTLYGLGGRFLSLAAHGRIDALKGRDGQPYSAAAAGLEMLGTLVADVPAVFGERLCGLLPGPFTFLFKPAPGLDPRLLRDSAAVGVRIPALPPLLRLIEALGFPLVSTSANRSGRPPLNDPERIAREFPGLDIVIDGGVLPPSPGSTVVDLTAEPPRVVRSGAGHERLLAALAAGD
jgi:L-threonylcarbamoyladenylate synthase